METNNNYYEKSVAGKLGGDAKFVGFMNIVLGVINCLTISGIIGGIFMILTGMKAKDAGQRFQNYAAFGDEREEYLALESLGGYFKWMKILIIVTFALMILGFVFALLGGSLFNRPDNPEYYL